MRGHTLIKLSAKFKKARKAIGAELGYRSHHKNKQQTGVVCLPRPGLERYVWTPTNRGEGEESSGGASDESDSAFSGLVVCVSRTVFSARAWVACVRFEDYALPGPGTSPAADPRAPLPAPISLAADQSPLMYPSSLQAPAPAEPNATADNLHPPTDAAASLLAANNDLQSAASSVPGGGPGSCDEGDEGRAERLEARERRRRLRKARDRQRRREFGQVITPATSAWAVRLLSFLCIDRPSLFALALRPFLSFERSFRCALSVVYFFSS